MAPLPCPEVSFLRSEVSFLCPEVSNLPATVGFLVRRVHSFVRRVHSFDRRVRSFDRRVHSFVRRPRSVVRRSQTCQPRLVSLFGGFVPSSGKLGSLDRVALPPVRAALRPQEAVNRSDEVRPRPSIPRKPRPVRRDLLPGDGEARERPGHNGRPHVRTRHQWAGLRIALDLIPWLPRRNCVALFAVVAAMHPRAANPGVHEFRHKRHECQQAMMHQPG